MTLHDSYHLDINFIVCQTIYLYAAIIISSMKTCLPHPGHGHKIIGGWGFIYTYGARMDPYPDGGMTACTPHIAGSI